jgi:zinc transport system permease protein
MIANHLAALGLPLSAADEHWLDRLIDAFTLMFPRDSFFSESYNVRALLALVLVSLSCGAVGSLVVGGRMAFFSDALAHCAFAGISIGFVFFEALVAHGQRAQPGQFWEWVTPIMILFGVLVGYGIVFIRTRTGLASDTVIGVFFAGSIGLAAMLRKILHRRELFSLEDFLFGDPLLVQGPDLVYLAGLLLFTAVLLGVLYNRLLLASFSNSLALSRRVPVRLVNYLFVMLLAVLVNLSLRCVGVLLINALLIVPAATAANVSRNMRQMFWLTILLCLAVSVGGQWIAHDVEARTRVPLGIPGVVILLSVLLFVVSMLLGHRIRGRQSA